MSGRCELSLRDCLSHHWLPYLPGSTGRGDQFSAYCPGCRLSGSRSRCLSLTVGRTRILYRCHWRYPCSQETVRAALIQAGITCLPPVRHRKPPRDQFRDEVLRLLDMPMSAAAFRFRVAIAAWEADAKTVAERLGIPRTTYYRLLTSPRNGTEPQVGVIPLSPKNGTPESAAAVPKMGRHRRSA